MISVSFESRREMELGRGKSPNSSGRVPFGSQTRRGRKSDTKGQILGYKLPGGSTTYYLSYPTSGKAERQESRGSVGVIRKAPLSPATKAFFILAMMPD